MAAGQGFKTFATGDVLSASDVNGYLMQGVLVFADATERNAEITSPQEGQFAYLKDTNVTTYYTGSAWANLDTTGMTNPMTTTGDTIYSSSGSTPARLAIGSTGQVLTVTGGVPTWATPATSASGLTLISTQTASDVATITFDNVFTSTYLSYLFVFNGVRSTSSAFTADLLFQFRYAGPTTQASGYRIGITGVSYNGSAVTIGTSGTAAIISQSMGDSSYKQSGHLFIDQVGQTSEIPLASGQMIDTYKEEMVNIWTFCGTARTYTGFTISTSSGNFNGTFSVYGLAKS